MAITPNAKNWNPVGTNKWDMGAAVAKAAKSNTLGIGFGGAPKTKISKAPKTAKTSIGRISKMSTGLK